jgi:hypothetical protein
LLSKKKLLTQVSPGAEAYLTLMIDEFLRFLVVQAARQPRRFPRIDRGPQLPNLPVQQRGLKPQPG